MPSGISSFFGLNTALRGLQASQASLDVTAHNIANADTDGYSRQSVQLQQFVGLTHPRRRDLHQRPARSSAAAST